MVVEWLSNFAKPQVIGPLIGLVAVIGWVIVTVFKMFFKHQERIEMIRNGMHPDEPQDEAYKD
jgi:hypothetical protein